MHIYAYVYTYKHAYGCCVYSFLGCCCDDLAVVSVSGLII